MIKSRFTKAEKKKSKLRLALQGPAGSGKTYSGLAIAEGLGGSIAVIDTERGSASLYADRFDFSVLELENLNPEGYIEAIKDAKDSGIEILIIDSLSHAWESLKERVGPLAKAKFGGNTWAAWSVLTPIQNSLIQAILTYPGHVISTMRSKTAWDVGQGGEGGSKSKPKKVGLAAIQREGVDYEFTIVLEMTQGGIADVGKTRWSAIEGKTIEKPGKKFASDILEWLNSGAAEVAPQERPAPENPPREEPPRSRESDSHHRPEPKESANEAPRKQADTSIISTDTKVDDRFIGLITNEGHLQKLRGLPLHHKDVNGSLVGIAEKLTPEQHDALDNFQREALGVAIELASRRYFHEVQALKMGPDDYKAICVTLDLPSARFGALKPWQQRDVKKKWESIIKGRESAAAKALEAEEKERADLLAEARSCNFKSGKPGSTIENLSLEELRAVCEAGRQAFESKAAKVPVIHKNDVSSPASRAKGKEARKTQSATKERDDYDRRIASAVATLTDHIERKPENERRPAILALATAAQWSQAQIERIGPGSRVTEILLDFQDDAHSLESMTKAIAV